MPAPLTGIRILDFTRYQNGPHATVMLSDMGADVLKVEPPNGGDLGRTIGLQPDGFCAYFEGHSRGKRSITLDIGTPEGQEIARALAKDVDVVTENYKPGVMERFGLGYDELKAINPRIIYGSNSGFGPRGPWTSRGSFDVVAQGMSGAMVAQGGGPGAEPENVAFGVADQVGSIIFAYGIMAAVVARERYGVGQRVDTSLLGSMTTLQASMITGFLHTGTQMRRTSRAFNPTFTHYQAGDGEWFTIGAFFPKQWPGMCIAIERPDLIDDPRCAEPFARMENRDWLMEEIGKAVKVKPRDYWVERLVEQEVPCGPCYDYAGVTSEPQFWENGYLVELEHPRFEGHRAVGVPVELSETPGGVQGPAPQLGEHTDAVLAGLGLSPEKIAALRAKRVV